MRKRTSLEEVASTEFRWRESAEGILNDNWEMKSIIADHAEDLQRSFLRGFYNIQELRGGVVWANALDREAVELYGSDLAGGDQLKERVARRIMHHSGRLALSTLSSTPKQIAYIACNQRKSLVQ